MPLPVIDAERETERVEAGGFGGRTFRANGLEILVEPLRRVHADGSSGITLGFPFATVSDIVSEDVAAELAEYLSSPIRAAAPELNEALSFARNQVVSLFLDTLSPEQAVKQVEYIDKALSKARTGAPE